MDIKVLLEKYPFPWRIKETRLRRTLHIVVVDPNGNHVFAPFGETADEIRQLGTFLITAAEAFAR